MDKNVQVIMIFMKKVLFEIGVFLVPFLCGENDKNCSEFGGFDIFVFVHAGLWVFKYMFDRCYQYHHMKSRRHGYLEFYRTTRLIRSLPLIIISAGFS